jgi:uncharacterized protein (TIGR02246 family)
MANAPIIVAPGTDCETRQGGMMNAFVPGKGDSARGSGLWGRGGKMKQLLSNLLAALLFAGCAAHAQNKTDEAAVHHVPQAFAAAWATHDGHQLAKTMSDDVDFVNVGGDWLHGRADFELYHTRLLSGRFRESTLTPLETAVRFLRPDLAVLHWSWRIQGDRNEDLTPRKPRFGLFTMIVEKRRGEWLVVVAQNTNWMAGPNPELMGIEPPIVFPNAEEKP